MSDEEFEKLGEQLNTAGRVFKYAQEEADPFIEAMNEAENVLIPLREKYRAELQRRSNPNTLP